MLLDLFWLFLFLFFAYRFVKAALLQQPITRETMAEHGPVKVINSVEEWEHELEEAHRHKKIIVVDFTAVWCGPCRLMAPIFAELAKQHQNLIFLKVDVDNLLQVASKWDVHAMPTFVFIKEKKAIHRIVGANRDELEKKATFYASTSS